MFVTVAVCTWNRARLLDQTLACMEGLRIPPGTEWELVVVDNNSTDDTAEVLARRGDRLPLRRVLEPQQGTAFARNRALEVARGELLIWTDDDVLMGPDWLAAYVRAAGEHPEAAFFGGPIEPHFTAEPPAWLAANLSVFAGAFAIRHAPDVAILRGTEYLPFTANVALRLVACQAMRFDTNVGHVRDVVMGAEDMVFLRELVAQGKFGVWVPEAGVRHQLPEERLHLSYLWRHYRGKGRARVRLGRTQPPLLQLVWKYWRARVKTWSRSFRRDDRWARAFKASATMKGIIEELRAGGRAAR